MYGAGRWVGIPRRQAQVRPAGSAAGTGRHVPDKPRFRTSNPVQEPARAPPADPGERGTVSTAARLPPRQLALRAGHVRRGGIHASGKCPLALVSRRPRNRYWPASPPPPTCMNTTLWSAPGGGKSRMFDRRDELIKFLAVAEAGGVTAAADLLGITQPALSRIIAKLERRFRGRLFERLPTGVRLTRLGGAAFDLARHVRDETAAAEARFEAFTSGRSGSFRVTAEPTWMQAVLPAAVARFNAACPGVELKLRTAGFRRGRRLLADGRTDLHCGGIDSGEPLPPSLRRERFLDAPVGIVAHSGHPLHAQAPTPADLAGCPWIDFDAPPRFDARHGRPSLATVLEDLHDRTSRRVRTIIRAGSEGRFLTATGPYLAWVPLGFLEGMPGPALRPLSLEFGRSRGRSGLVSSRAAEGLAPFRLLKKIVRDVALGGVR